MNHPTHTRIEDRTARVAVIGLGYVGLPLLKSFWEVGFPVLGVDVDPSKIEKLARGESYLGYFDHEWVHEMTASDRFEATDDFDALGRADAILVAVPTPLGEHREPDLSYVERTTDAIAARLRPGQLVVLESTTYPGTSREVVWPRLAEAGLSLGREVFLAYSPEREDPGNTSHAHRAIPKLVGGVEPAGDEAGACGELAEALYASAFDRVHRVSSAEVAEAAKILENVYRAVNIGLVNEMKVLLTKLGVDVWEVIEAAKTKPFGFQAFYPGPGLGGHCIPIDPFYLAWKAREVDISAHFIELAGEINRGMPSYVVQRTTTALNHHKKAVNGSRVLVIGLSYKPNVGDLRESPSLEIIDELRSLGAEVTYHDPHIPRAWRTRDHDLTLESVPLTAERLAASDCVVVATHHDACDWQLVADHAPLVVDTRAVMKTISSPRAAVFPA